MPALNRADILTWQNLRQVAEYEVLTPVLTPRKVLITSMVPERPQITWPSQYHWFAKAEPTVPPAGAVVYARSAWGSLWRKDLLTRLNDPIVLTSTFYDLPIKPSTAADMFDGDSPVGHWFAVQAHTRHPRLTPMPLGVKARMAPLLASAEVAPVKDILLYVNFQWTRIGRAIDESRLKLWQHFSALPWVTARQWQKDGIAPYLADLGRSRFVLSPPGLAWDCYRTYEAIAMGAIPIVLRNPPVTDVCESLPVMLVDDWSDVTRERLLNTSTRYWDSISTDTLTLSYWRDRIQHAAAQCREKVMA